MRKLKKWDLGGILEHLEGGNHYSAEVSQVEEKIVP
jgi:hypothetical protein